MIALCLDFLHLSHVFLHFTPRISKNLWHKIRYSLLLPYLNYTKNIWPYNKIYSEFLLPSALPTVCYAKSKNRCTPIRVSRMAPLSLSVLKL